jgi:hypothetical protein
MEAKNRLNEVGRPRDGVLLPLAPVLFRQRATLTAALLPT